MCGGGGLQQLSSCSYMRLKENSPDWTLKDSEACSNSYVMTSIVQMQAFWRLRK